jgi:predicted peptidase
MGGSSTLEAVALAPDLFAAALAVAPVPNFNSIPALGKTPVWLIHGNADKENDVAGSKLLYSRLIQMRANAVRFWEFDKMGHGLFPTVYASDEIPRWLFHHRRESE